MGKAIVLAEGCLGEDMGKTANGLVLHSMKHEVVAVIDSTRAGQDAGQLVSGRANGIPVVATFDEAYEGSGAEVFYLGAATVGGVLPAWFDSSLRVALEHGMTVFNGLHTFFGDDPEYVAIAKEHGGTIIDVRKPPRELHVATGRVQDVQVPRVLIMGTDCAVGKRMTAMELIAEAKRRGINAGFVATGQTGCMLGPDAGAVIDRIPSDFCAGVVEGMVVDVAEQGREMIFIYGQASILHPSYSGVALSILHGARPDAIILQHDPVRTQRVLFDHPRYKVAPLRDEILLIERLGSAPVVAIAANGRDCTDIESECVAITQATGLPCADPLAMGSGVLLDAVLETLAAARTPDATSMISPGP